MKYISDLIYNLNLQCLPDTILPETDKMSPVIFLFEGCSMKKIKSGLLLLPFMLLLLVSCVSAPDKIDSNLPEELFFKTAQDAMDLNQYRVALYYYEVYLVRYPENHRKTIAAEYERAFIYYKTKDYEYSKSLFTQILDKYENGSFAIMYHDRYRILSEKILYLIGKELNKNIEEV